MDVDIFRAIHIGWNSPVLDPIFWFFSYSGLGVIIGLTGLILLSSRKTKPYGIAIALGALFGGLLFAQGFKSVIPRDRPSNLSWAKPQEPHKLGSFPSAHTGAAFGAATSFSIIAFRRRKTFLIPPAMIWAVGVGVSRIYRGVHWPSDVLGGACLGILAACLIGLLPFASQSDETKT